MRRSTTLKSSSSVMRKMGETRMRRELRASELGPSRERRGFSFMVYTCKGVGLLLILIPVLVCSQQGVPASCW